MAGAAKIGAVCAPAVVAASKGHAGEDEEQLEGHRLSIDVPAVVDASTEDAQRVKVAAPIASSNARRSRSISTRRSRTSIRSMPSGPGPCGTAKGGATCSVEAVDTEAASEAASTTVADGPASAAAAIGRAPLNVKDLGCKLATCWAPAMVCSASKSAPEAADGVLANIGGCAMDSVRIGNPVAPTPTSAPAPPDAQLLLSTRTEPPRECSARDASSLQLPLLPPASSRPTSAGTHPIDAKAEGAAAAWRRPRMGMGCEFRARLGAARPREREELHLPAPAPVKRPSPDVACRGLLAHPSKTPDEWQRGTPWP